MTELQQGAAATETMAEAFRKAGVVPVVEIADVGQAVPLAEALLAGGLGLAEITLRTGAAVAVIERIRRYLPEFLAGAGTIVTIDQARAALDAGALFGVAPGTDDQVVAHFRAAHVLHIPGAATASEITHALRLGCTTVKLFPANLVGGVRAVTAFNGPFASSGIRFMPTGGVGPDSLQEYLSTPGVLAVGGTWIAPRADIEAGAWKAIRERAAAAAALALSVRPLAPAVGSQP
jgi:2-dehydro-3-deoxyphosphogluconate aldolase/(4S)-4-hydroxy-2-oxoglutarate aldolase